MDWRTASEIGATILLSLGGASAIILAVSSWLGKVWASRILEKDRAHYRREVDTYTHQLSIQKTAYERYLDLIVDYHDLMYRHYRLCQLTERADTIIHPDKGEINTKQHFMISLDSFRDSLGEIEGKLRIILPKNILDEHNELIGEFNNFRAIVKEFSNSAESLDRMKLNQSMEKIVNLQSQHEISLRELLRTENVLR